MDDRSWEWRDELLVPGVKHGRDSGLPALPCCKVLERVRGCRKEQVVDRLLVEGGQQIDGVVQGEDQVEVWHMEKLGLLLLQPPGPLERSARRAVPVIARVPQEHELAAPVALFDAPPERRGAAAQDRADCLDVMGRQTGSIGYMAAALSFPGIRTSSSRLCSSLTRLAVMCV